MTTVTVGICAYNEADNIENAIRSVYQQNIDFELENVIVISSGSDDGTDDIVRGLMGTFSTLKLFPQEKREGKNSAINLLLDNNTSEIVALLNADTAISEKDSLSHLIAPFSDPSVGIVGGHPITTNRTDTAAGFASNMIWVMHHHISLLSPKIGELIAFRDIGTRLPLDMQSDEDLLRMGLEKNGYRAAYAPEAKIFIRGPETMEDFMKQRVRVNIGQIYMKKNKDFESPTWNKRLLIRAFFNSLPDLGIHPLMLIQATYHEAKARYIAKKYVSKDKGDKNIWEPVRSTKKL